MTGRADLQGRIPVPDDLDAVTAGREPPVSGSDALETLLLLQQIYDTAEVLGD